MTICTEKGLKQLRQCHSFMLLAESIFLLQWKSSGTTSIRISVAVFAYSQIFAYPDVLYCEYVF